MVNTSNKLESDRKAWRALLVPAVGSAAFFAASVVNIIRTYKKHGFPDKAFNPSDYLLLTLPFIIFFLALHEEMENGE